MGPEGGEEGLWKLLNWGGVGFGGASIHSKARSLAAESNDEVAQIRLGSGARALLSLVLWLESCCRLVCLRTSSVAVHRGPNLGLVQPIASPWLADAGALRAGLRLEAQDIAECRHGDVGCARNLGEAPLATGRTVVRVGRTTRNSRSGRQHFSLGAVCRRYTTAT